MKVQDKFKTVQTRLSQVPEKEQEELKQSDFPFKTLINNKEVQLKDIYLFIKSEDDIITLIKNNLEETKSIIREEAFITSITENTKCTISFINAIFSDELSELIDNKFDFVFKVIDTARDQNIKNHCISIISNYGISARNEVEKLEMKEKNHQEKFIKQ